MKRIIRYFRDFYAHCGEAVIGYLLLTIVHKILAFISPPAAQRLIDAVIGGSGSSQGSISTRQLCALQPCPSRELPRSSVSTLGLPCLSSDPG